MTEDTRRDVLEHPERYSADVRADAWDMTAQQCREHGPPFAWAAEIAEHEATMARRYAAHERIKEKR